MMERSEKSGKAFMPFRAIYAKTRISAHSGAAMPAAVTRRKIKNIG